jgi:hypothetical protein
MRYLLILLLLVNVLLFGWMATHPVTEEEKRLPPIAPDIAQLALLSEQQAPESTPKEQAVHQEVAKEGAKQEPLEIVRQCYTLGPMMNEKALEKLRSRLEEQGYSVQTRSIEQQETAGYWVYLPPYENRKQALKIAAELARKGIKDYYVVTDKEFRNAVSLGLFSDKGRANRRMAHIRTLGYQSRKMVRYRDRTYHWLDYDESSDNPLPEDVWSDLGSSKQKVQRLDRSCD